MSWQLWHRPSKREVVAPECVALVAISAEAYEELKWLLIGMGRADVISAEGDLDLYKAGLSFVKGNSRSGSEAR